MGGNNPDNHITSTPGETYGGHYKRRENRRQNEPTEKRLTRRTKKTLAGEEAPSRRKSRFQEGIQTRLRNAKPRTSVIATHTTTTHARGEKAARTSTGRQTWGGAAQQDSKRGAIPSYEDAHDSRRANEDPTAPTKTIRAGPEKLTANTDHTKKEES